MLVLVLALAAAFAWRTETSRDFGYHVATGRWILEHHTWPRVDTFTYTLAGKPYIDMHGLFQVLLALAWRGGMAGVAWLRLACVLGTVALLWRTALDRGVRSAALLGVGFGLALCILELRFMARPELASHVCLAALMLLLQRHARTGNVRWLYAAIPLQLVWVWSHALSLFGIAVLGLYALASIPGAVRRGAMDRAPWVALAGATAVMFLNPYGAAGVAFLWNLRTRIAAGNAFGESIAELASPFAASSAGVLPLVGFKLMLVATAIVMITRLRRVPLFDIAVLIMFGALAATHVRNVGLFAIAALPIGLGLVADLGRWLAPRAPRVTVAMSTATVALVIAALALLAQQAISGGWYAANNRPMRFGVGESPAVFPVATTALLDRHHLDGRVFNTLDFGGYLILHRPEQPVFIDGRLEVTGEDFYSDYTSIVAGDGWDAMVAAHQPKLALVSHTAYALLRRIHADPAWMLIDADGAGVLFARDLPEHRETIAEAAQRLTELDRPVAASEESIAPPPRLGPFAALFSWRRVAFDHWGRGNAFMVLDMQQAARREFAAALRQSDRPEPAIVKAYVSAALRLDRLDETRAWCRRLVELTPKDEQAQALLARLEGR